MRIQNLGRLCNEGGDWTLPANVRLLLGLTTSAAWECGGERVEFGQIKIHGQDIFPLLILLLSYRVHQMHWFSMILLLRTR